MRARCLPAVWGFWLLACMPGTFGIWVEPSPPPAPELPLPARFEGDRAVVGWFEAQRVSFWETPLALAGYAGVLALGILAAAVYGMVRLVRRLRAPRPA